MSTSLLPTSTAHNGSESQNDSQSQTGLFEFLGECRKQFGQLLSFKKPASNRFSQDKILTKRNELLNTWQPQSHISIQNNNKPRHWFFNRRDGKSTTNSEFAKFWNEAWLEQYKLHIETVENLSTRRHEMNKFFFTILSLLIGGIMALPEENANLMIGSGLIGTFTTAIWRILLITYSEFAGRKLFVVEVLESMLPLQIARMQHDHNSEQRNFKSISSTEFYLPCIFFWVFLIMLFYGIFIWICGIVTWINNKPAEFQWLSNLIVTQYTIWIKQASCL